MSAPLAIPSPRPMGSLRRASVRGRRPPWDWQWPVALFVAVTLEGLGRKFLPQVPSSLFYFLKDVVLVAGLLKIGVRKDVKAAALWLVAGWRAVLIPAFVVTLLQVLNPSNSALVFGVLGLRAYWLWWVAPLVLASSMRQGRSFRRVLMVLGVLACGIYLFGAYQFRMPAGDSINTYALYEGKEVNNVDTVASTGRVRVSSTFSYLSGFAAFSTTFPALFLAFGLRQRGKVRWACLVAAGCGAATMPMAGSRGAVVLGAAYLGAVVWGAGFLGTRLGRRLIVGATFAGALSVFAVPEAMEGVMSRFNSTLETSKRLGEGWYYVPPVALALLDYPIMGQGTGSQQNAAVVLRATTREQVAEGEVGRLLIELGPLGYLLVWLCRLGLAIALIRAGRFLRRHGRGAEAGAALALCMMVFTGPITFDHVYQALFFFCVGLVLHSVVEVRNNVFAAASLPPRGPREAGRKRQFPAGVGQSSRAGSMAGPKPVAAALDVPTRTGRARP